jgi:hypothetical protein
MDAPPRPLVEVLADVAAAEIGHSSDNAAEFAEQHLEPIANFLRSEMESADRAGNVCRVTFNSSAEDLIQGSCFIEPIDAPEVQAAKGRRMNFEAFHGFLSALDWRGFEACCKGMLELMGCTDPVLTASGNDQGIDFYGQLSLAGRLASAGVLPGVDRRLNVWMVGQAKHYQRSRVATPDLRNLVGAVDLARARAFSDGGKAITSLDIRACDPVFYLFFTTGDISRDGRRLLEASGMIGMDGAHVAAFLADNNVGVDLAGDFKVAIAQAWIAGHS